MAKTKIGAKLASAALILGGLFYGVNAFGVNVFEMISNTTNPWIGKAIYAAVGVSAISVIWAKLSNRQ